MEKGVGKFTVRTIGVWALISLLLYGCLPSREALDGTQLHRDVDAGPGETTLIFAGDVMLARGVNRVLASRGPDYVWGEALSLLREADLTIANLECTISSRGQPFQPRRVFYFRAEPQTALTALEASGIDLLSLANNHVMDYGAEALRETRETLDRGGIRYAGAGPFLADAARAVLLDVRGIKVAFFAGSDHYEEYAATPDAPGIHLVSVGSEKPSPHLQEVIRRIRPVADLVIFSLHWGPNLRQEPAGEFIDFGHMLIDAGVDVVHGHSAHVFQGIEWYGGGLILYDTGDLIDDYAVRPDLRNDLQFLFRVPVGPEGKLSRVELFPVRINHMRLEKVSSPDYAIMVSRMADLSRRFGTGFMRESGRMISYRPQTPP